MTFFSPPPEKREISGCFFWVSERSGIGSILSPEHEVGVSLAAIYDGYYIFDIQLSPVGMATKQSVSSILKSSKAYVLMGQGMRFDVMHFWHQKQLVTFWYTYIYNIYIIYIYM